MRRLAHTIKNMIYPDPRNDGLNQVMEEIRLNRECPWKRSDWIGLAILSLLVFCLIAFTGCGKQMSGIYEMDMSQTMAQMGLPQAQGMPDMGAMGRIIFNGNRLTVQMGMTEMRGTYKVKDDLIQVTVEGYGPNGQFPLYIVDDNTIKFQGAIFKRKQ